MKRFILLLIVVSLTNIYSAAQVGINNTDPKATLDINVIDTSSITPEGLIAPRLTGDQIRSKDAQYGTDQVGTLIYAFSPVTTSSTKTVNITQSGYYFFNGTLWIPLGGADGTDDAWINSSGVINMGTLSDGVTARVTNEQFTFKDNGSAVFGSSLLTYPSKLTLVNNASGNPLNDNLELASFGPATELGNEVYPIIDISSSVGTETARENFPDSRSNPVGVGEIRWNAQANGSRMPIAHIGVRYAGDGATDDGTITLNTGTSLEQVNGLTIDQNNNVGIGDQTPNSKLQVNGSFSAPIRSFSGNVLASDYTILGAGNVFLPTAVGVNGRIYKFVFDGINYQIIGNLRFDGANFGSITISNTTRFVTVQSNNARWVIIDL